MPDYQLYKKSQGAVQYFMIRFIDHKNHYFIILEHQSTQCRKRRKKRKFCLPFRKWKSMTVGSYGMRVLFLLNNHIYSSKTPSRKRGNGLYLQSYTIQGERKEAETPNAVRSNMAILPLVHKKGYCF